MSMSNIRPLLLGTPGDEERGLWSQNTGFEFWRSQLLAVYSQPSDLISALVSLYINVEIV